MIVEISIFVVCLALMLLVPSLLILMQWQRAFYTWVALVALLLGGWWVRDIVAPVAVYHEMRWDAEIQHALLVLLSSTFGISVLQGWGVAWLTARKQQH